MDTLIGTIWYDDYNYAGVPADHPDRRTARVVEVVDDANPEYARVRVIGGKNERLQPGRVTMVKKARLGKSGGYKPFPEGLEIPNRIAE